MALNDAHNKYCAALRVAISILDADKIQADKDYRRTYSKYTVKQLHELAKRHGFKGLYKLNKAQLIDKFSLVNEFTKAAERKYHNAAYEAAVVMNKANELEAKAADAQNV